MPFTPTISLELIEQYVLGQLDAVRQQQVEAAAVHDAAVRNSIEELRAGLERFVKLNAVEPPNDVREKLLSRLAVPDVERLPWPPVIHAGSRISDYERWINAPAMVRPADAGDVFFIPFADNADGLSAIVWLVNGSPEETHADQIEKFLIVEGSCEISMQGLVIPLAVGDVFSIPLHTPHTVKVTSVIPCKVVLQRLAA